MESSSALPPSSAAAAVPRALPVDEAFMRGADGAVEAPLPVQRPERGWTRPRRVRSGIGCGCSN